MFLTGAGVVMIITGGYVEPHISRIVGFAILIITGVSALIWCLAAMHCPDK
jgi:TRAP-type mannitol/chloroaromatic compound transport system permease small subunit